MSTPPDRSTLSAYAAAASSNANKAQAGAVAVAGAIGKNIARGAASWINTAVSTVSDHLPAARSATQYYSYDAQRASQGAYKRAKRTIAHFAGGAAALSSWMGLDLTDRELEHHLAARATSSTDNNGSSNQQEQRSPDSPLTADAGAVELLPGYWVPGESECHYTPKPTGLGGQVEVSRVQVQLAPVFVASPELYRHQASATGGAASASFSMSGENNSQNATLCLSLVGPGGAPGFAIFRIDCTDVYEECVELHLMELEALGAVKSVCVAEIVAPASSSSSNARYRQQTASGGSSSATQQQQQVMHQKVAVILTERCILQYSIAQRKVMGFQSLAFEAADLKLSAYFAIVVHSGFGQLSVLSLYGNNNNNNSGGESGSSPGQLRGMGSGSSASLSSSHAGGGGGNNSSNNNNNAFTFALDELDVLVPESDEIAISDRWIAYVGSGSDAARTSTRLLSYAERTRTENISKNIHKGLSTVGGFLGAAVSKAMQVSGVSSSPSSQHSQQQHQQQNQDYDDGLVFNPRAVGAQPIDSSDKSIGTVVIRDLHTKCDIAAFVAHDNPIQKMAFDETGTILATCANDGKHIHVFRICPRGSATRSTTVSTAASLSRLPRLPSMGSMAGGSSQSLYGLGAGIAASSSVGGGSGDNLAGMASSPNAERGSGNNNNNNVFPPSSSGDGGSNINNNTNAPCTTVIFTHRIARGVTGGTITSLSFSQPWSWLAATTTVGTAHFFRLNLDRLCNVEENIVAGESGLQPAVNVAGASFRIRSAPATAPPAPVVCFFPGEAATGAGEQTTACVVTKTATVATAVVSTTCDKGFVLYERGASQFGGPKREHHHHPASTAARSKQNQQQQRFMTAEAAWMELLHRRTQPVFAPLHTGIKVQPLPTPVEDEDEEQDE